ncbi:MAG: acyltransferase [Planctomycetes bacterium]|nr:acyltransferase [Planctomycetota bacterium]
MKLSRFLYQILRIGPDLYKTWITYWPGALGDFLRYRYYKRRLKFLGKNVIIDFGAELINPSMISIGDHTHIDRWVVLGAGEITRHERQIYHKQNPHYSHNRGEIHIGRRVHIAPYVYLLGAGGIDIGDYVAIASGARIFSVSGHYSNLNDKSDKRLYSFSNTAPFENQSLIIGAVVMGKNSAVGLNSVVLPGSTIGENSWIGVLSLVLGTIAPNVIAKGNPAREVKTRTGPLDLDNGE